MKKIPALLGSVAFLVTDVAVHAVGAAEGPAPPDATKVPPGASRLLDSWVAVAFFVAVAGCLLLSLLIWRLARSKATDRKEGEETTDKDLEALRISYGFWLVVGALLVTLLVLVITLTAMTPEQPKTADIVAIIGAVTGVIGTLTAAFFGIQAAGAGRSQALTTLDNTLKNQGAVPAPTPTKLDPSYGPHSGSTRISITGNGLTGASGVNFGVTPGANFEFVNDGLVRVSSPVAVDKNDEAKVVIVYPGATPGNRDAGTFYYYTIDPHHGVGVQSVKIRGAALKEVKAVKFGQKEQTPVFDPNQNQLTVSTPSRADAGNVDDVDVTLIYPVDKPTNTFVIGKYHYDDSSAAGTQSQGGGVVKPSGPPSPGDGAPKPSDPSSPGGGVAKPSGPPTPGDGSAKPSGPPPVSKPDHFPACIPLTLQWEGGNDDDPRDPGGRTSRGIIQREWNVWRQSHPGLPADVWQAPQDQVVAIYRESYWNVLSCDQLPVGVDYCVFDYGVNSGNARAASVLQQIVGTTVDGEVGPLTIAATAKVDAASLVNKICDQRLAFLKGLGTWRTFGAGWTNRVEGVRKQATAMIGAPTAPAEKLPASLVGDPPWLVKARSFEGFRWASDNPPEQMKEWIDLIETNSPNIPGLAQYCNVLASGYRPWCGMFVAAMLAEAGLPPVFAGTDDTDRFAWAPAWDKYGTKVDIENGELPHPGDVMRFSWHGGGEHVTFYDHPVETDDLYHCCGGNQGSGHVVSIEGMPMNCIVAVRRPPAPAVAAAQPSAPPGAA